MRKRRCRNFIKYFSRANIKYTDTCCHYPITPRKFKSILNIKSNIATINTIDIIMHICICTTYLRFSKNSFINAAHSSAKTPAITAVLG